MEWQHAPRASAKIGVYVILPHFFGRLDTLAAGGTNDNIMDLLKNFFWVAQLLS